MTSYTRSLRIAGGAIVTLALFASPLLAAAATTNYNTGGGATGGYNTGGGGTGCGVSCTVKNPLNAPDFKTLIEQVLRGILIIAVPIIVIFIVYSGFLFVTARGNTTQLETARRNFMWVIIGSVVLIGASAIAAIIASTIRAFGVPGV